MCHETFEKHASSIYFDSLIPKTIFKIRKQTRESNISNNNRIWDIMLLNKNIKWRTLKKLLNKIKQPRYKN